MDKICNAVRPEIVREHRPARLHKAAENLRLPYMPGAFPGTTEAAPAPLDAPDVLEATGLPGLYRDLTAPLQPADAALVIEALKEANEALQDHWQQTQREYAEVQSQLPWLVRRLGRKMARVVLPCVVAGAVTFAALSLPILSLFFGAAAGVATWFALADKDPNPNRTMPEQEAPRMLRPRLAADTLEGQMKVYAQAQNHLSFMLNQPRMHETRFANDTFRLFVSDIDKLLDANKSAIKPLEDERSWTVGARAMAGPASHWLVSVGILGVLNGLNAMVDLPFPFGVAPRLVAAIITSPLLQLITVFYGAQVANKWRASLNSRQQVVADRLHVRRGEREALQEVLNVYRRAQYRLDRRLPGVVQLKFRVMDALGRPR